MRKTLNLKVVGDHTMHCSGCERSVEFALAQLSGVEDIKADWRAQQVQVTLNSEEVDSDAVTEQLSWLGYQAEVQ